MVGSGRAADGPDNRAPPLAPGLWATAATLLALVALLALGTWQLERLAWARSDRDARSAARDAGGIVARHRLGWRTWDFRPAIMQGEFRHDLERLFGVAAIDGRVGHDVLTPLVRPDGIAVLDRSRLGARGPDAPGGAPRPWRLEARSGSRASRATAATPPGWFTPDNRPEQSLWYWYDLGALERALGLPLLPVVVEADATPNGRAADRGRTRTEVSNNHLQYAITWYGLAAGLLVIWVSFGRARGRRG